MPRKGKRTRIARSCYEDGSGRSIIVRDPRTGRPKEFRHPPHTAVTVMRTQAELWLRSRGARRKRADDRWTLTGAIAQLEKTEGHLTSWDSRRAELRAWADTLGSKRLYFITDTECAEIVSAWLKAGLAPKTVRNRIWSLKHLFRKLYGPDTMTPVDQIAPPEKVRRVINPTPVETILAVYRNLLAFEQKGLLRDAKTRARFMVRAATGRRPVEIMRAQPDDVDLGRRVWRVRDAKGGWSEGLYLNDDMLVAWALFCQANAWGQFDTGSMAEVLRHAGWPSERDARGKYTSRPYNLRHSTGIHLSELGIDLEDVAAWLGQTDTRTTRQNYVPVLKGRMQRMAELIDGRFSGWKAEPKDEVK